MKKKQYFCTRFLVGSDLRRLHRTAIRLVDVLPPLRLKHRFASVLIGKYKSGGMLVKRYSDRRA